MVQSEIKEQIAKSSFLASLGITSAFVSSTLGPGSYRSLPPEPGYLLTRRAVTPSPCFIGARDLLLL